MNPVTVRRTVRASALYDLIVTAAFALPFTAPALFDVLRLLHESVGGAGEVPSAHSVFTVMFANLMGSLVVVWSIYRLIRPTREAGIADTAGRVLFSLGMIAALLHGASPLVWIMLGPELTWMLVQGVIVLAPRRAAA